VRIMIGASAEFVMIPCAFLKAFGELILDLFDGMIGGSMVE
jgi:hypothetical protein